MVSQPRSGTSASAHEPNRASPEANRPPNRASATSENPTVRRIGQSFDTLLVAVMVRPSSGSPRSPDSGQAMTLSGTDSRVRARVVPAAATTTADEHGQRHHPTGVAEHRRRREHGGEHGAGDRPRVAAVAGHHPHQQAGARAS